MEINPRSEKTPQGYTLLNLFTLIGVIQTQSHLRTNKDIASDKDPDSQQKEISILLYNNTNLAILVPCTWGQPYAKHVIILKLNKKVNVSYIFINK